MAKLGRISMLVLYFIITKTLTQYVELGFARLIDGFIISTPKLSPDSSSLCCTDSLFGIYLLSAYQKNTGLVWFWFGFVILTDSRN